MASGVGAAEVRMHRFFVGIGILIAAVAIVLAPSGAQVASSPAPASAEPARAIIGDDDLPDGAPIAAQVKRVCYVGPANATPICIFDTIQQCRAECRTKRLHQGKRGYVQCMLNPALQQPRPRQASLQVGLATRIANAPRER
jgi:hypothetical protein